MEYVHDWSMTNKNVPCRGAVIAAMYSIPIALLLLQNQQFLRMKKPFSISKETVPPIAVPGVAFKFVSPTHSCYGLCIYSLIFNQSIYCNVLYIDYTTPLRSVVVHFSTRTFCGNCGVLNRADRAGAIGKVPSTLAHTTTVHRILIECFIVTI